MAAEDSFVVSDVSDYDEDSGDDFDLVCGGRRTPCRGLCVTNACAAQDSPVKKAPKGKKGVLKESKKSANTGAGSKKRTKTVEETYVKMTQLQHILKRPDTYGECQRLSDCAPH